MRIITGRARGCNLKTPKGMSTRPTSDRVKESLFSILGRDVGGRVLDIFAGTGALGLEALSRGADSCVFIDKNTDDVIRFNAERTHLSDRCTILRGDVFPLLKRLGAQGKRFDMVFCDPPYHHGLAHRALEYLDNSDILAPDALVIVEYGGDEEDLPPTLSLRQVRCQRYGKTTRLGFYHLPPVDGVNNVMNSISSVNSADSANSVSSVNSADNADSADNANGREDIP